MNTNNPTTPNNPNPTPTSPGTTTTSTGQNTNPSNETPNRKFFIQTLEASLSPDQVKKVLADLDKNKGWNGDRVEKLLLPEEEKKLAAYDKLKVKDLPFNWEDQLARLKSLEIKQVNFNEIKKELTGWTDAFTDKKPNQVQEEFKQLEEQKKQSEENLNNRIKELEADLETSIQESKDIGKKLGEKITELEKSLNEWTQTFDNRELETVKKEWADLKQRPDISITEQEWLDDFARRPSITKIREKDQELVSKEQELVKSKAENTKLTENVSKFLKEWRTRRYVSIEEWPTTTQKAKEAIAELLKETETEWNSYLTDNNITKNNIPLILSSQDKNKDLIARIYQVLAWIVEARRTSEYELLFTRWNNGSEYNEEYDYDAGTLYLLGEYLKVKDPQPIPTTNP